MGQPVELPIKTLFGGVSRQPDSVRSLAQVEEADNVIPSVVLGGLEKRPPTHHIATTALSAAAEYSMFAIDRDATSRYEVVLGGGTIKVFDATTGAAQTVNALSADALTYLTGDPWAFAAVTIVDYTFIVNKAITVALAATTAPGIFRGFKQTFSALPGSPAVNDVWGITGTPDQDARTYYVLWDGATWNECAKPGVLTSLNAETMPYQLVRNLDTTWTFSKATWDPRPSGDAVLSPPPPFVGRTISDLFLFANRLGVLTDESVYTSRTNEYFAFWPEKAATDLASDPIELVAPSARVNVLRYAAPFRKALFVTSEKTQFEVSGSPFTTTSASIDPTTFYESDPLCRPAQMGDRLYFASKVEEGAVLYEYVYDDNTLSNVALDITLHCLGYVPSGIRQIATAPTSKRIFILPEDARNHLYCYTAYWTDNGEKVQSAWTKLIFGASETDAYIHSVNVIDNFVYLLIERNGQVCIERLSANRQSADTGMNFRILLDRRVSLTGTYDAGNNWTTWTTPYSHSNAVAVVRGGGFLSNKGARLNVTYPTGTTVRATGNHSSALCHVGVPYRGRIRLSRQYVRDQNGASVLTGRTQIHHFAVDLKDTGYLTAEVTPRARVTRRKVMSGREMGSVTNMIGSPPIVERGVFKFSVNSKADTTIIDLVSEEYLPFAVTGGVWEGMHFNVLKER